MAKKDGYYKDTQHQSASPLNKPARGGKTNPAFDSQVKTKSASWPGPDTDEPAVPVDLTNRKNRSNKATVK